MSADKKKTARKKPAKVASGTGRKTPVKPKPKPKKVAAANFSRGKAPVKPARKKPAAKKVV